MKYKNENEITAVVEAFKNGTIARDDWGHPEHIVVGAFYVWNNDFDMALSKMRDGIFNLLRAFEIDLSKENPYHETLTHFWIRLIDEYKNSKPENSFLENCNEMIEKFDKDYPLKLYSRGLLFSEEARRRFVEPDLFKDSYFLANSL